jgi:Rps23 Pro-64 3,4-dihydroxylase Tpa1-like proline 4-hydroxylase
METIADLVYTHLIAEKDALKSFWKNSAPVKHFYLDSLLPSEVATQLANSFPTPKVLRKLQTIRESKWVGINYKEFDPIIAEILFAFQNSKVVELIEEITEFKELLPDPTLYASGVSYMEKGDFLNPHLDNSHDGDGKNYRVLNLLYYCSENWELEFGGNLELWEQGISNGATIVSKFNRLVVMATDKQSWHSVSQVEENRARTCVSNYYFSPHSPNNKSYSHVTTYAGRPEQKLRGVILKVDGQLRNAVRRIFPRGIVKTKHRLQSRDTIL